MEYFEHLLGEALKRDGLGEVAGGGVQLAEEPAGIAFCDLELQLRELSDAVLAGIIERLEALGAPKGSKLITESTGREIPFGRVEGLPSTSTGPRCRMKSTSHATSTTSSPSAAG